MANQLRAKRLHSPLNSEVKSPHCLRKAPKKGSKDKSGGVALIDRVNKTKRALLHVYFLDLYGISGPQIFIEINQTDKGGNLS